jgi:hypothetical protein
VVVIMYGESCCPSQNQWETRSKTVHDVACGGGGKCNSFVVAGLAVAGLATAVVGLAGLAALGLAVLGLAVLGLAVLGLAVVALALGLAVVGSGCTRVCGASASGVSTRRCGGLATPCRFRAGGLGDTVLLGSGSPPPGLLRLVHPRRGTRGLVHWRGPEVESWRFTRVVGRQVDGGLVDGQVGGVLGEAAIKGGHGGANVTFSIENKKNQFLGTYTFEMINLMKRFQSNYPLTCLLNS